MPARVQLEHLQGNGSTVVPLVSARFRADDTSGLDTGSPITLPANVQAVVSATITGGTTAQDLSLIPVNGVFQEDDFAIIDSGNSRQEVVLITKATELQAIFRRGHPAGALMEKVTASYSKTFRLNVVSKPAQSVSNVRFSRNASLPWGIYDQMQMAASFSASHAVPWVSDATHVYSTVPTDPVLVFAGPQLNVGPIPVLVMIQWLFSGRPAPVGFTDAQAAEFLKLAPSRYRWCWDES